MHRQQWRATGAAADAVAAEDDVEQADDWHTVRAQKQPSIQPVMTSDRQQRTPMRQRVRRNVAAVVIAADTS